MWFRNLYLFKFEQPFSFSADELEAALQNHQLTDCPASQRESSGWISPFGRNNELMVLANQGCYLIRMAKQQRLLPTSVIKDHLLERVDEIEKRDDRKVSARERREIKEELEFELLPKSFTKNVHLDGWIDSRNNWLIINTSSPSRAEEFAQLLRNHLGRLSLVLPDSNTSPKALLTNWLSSLNPPKPFELGTECVFKSPDEQGSSVTFKRHTLMGSELNTNLEAGKFVCQLELIWNQKIRFVLTDDLLIKRVKFLDIMTDDFSAQGFESAEEKIDTEFALMLGEAGQLITRLLQLFED